MDAQAFIERWTAREGGAERANCQPFLAELCDVIGEALATLERYGRVVAVDGGRHAARRAA